MLRFLILLELIYAGWEIRIYHITLYIETQVLGIIYGRCSLSSSVNFCYLKVLNVFSHQGNENWNYLKIRPIPVRMAITRNTKCNKWGCECGGGGEGKVLDSIDGSVNLAVIWKSGWRIFKKTRTRNAIWCSYPTPGDMVKGLSILPWRHRGIIFIVAFSTKARK